MDFCEFEANLVFRGSSKTAKATHRNLVQNTHTETERDRDRRERERERERERTLFVTDRNVFSLDYKTGFVSFSFPAVYLLWRFFKIP